MTPILLAPEPASSPGQHRGQSVKNLNLKKKKRILNLEKMIVEKRVYFEPSVDALREMRWEIRS